MTGNGERIVDTEQELSNGRVEQLTLESSETIVDMVMERLFMRMEQNMRANGETIREMEKASSPGLMDPITKGISEMILCMAKEYSRGKVSRVTQDHGDTTRNMAKARWFTKIKVFISVAGRMINVMVKAQ